MLYASLHSFYRRDLRSCTLTLVIRSGLVHGLFPNVLTVCALSLCWNTQYVFDLTTRQWQSQAIQIKVDPVPFSRGALRLVYHMIVRDPYTDCVCMQP